MSNGPVSMTIEQKRAEYALGTVRPLEARDDDFRKRFRAYAKSLPAMIRMNGLGQAAAFCRAKGAGNGKEADAYQNLYDIVSDWLVLAPQPLAGNAELLDGITKVNASHYRVAQTEAMALMEWVRKFAMAFLADEKKEAEDGKTEAVADGAGAASDA